MLQFTSLGPVLQAFGAHKSKIAGDMRNLSNLPSDRLSGRQGIELRWGPHLGVCNSCRLRCVFTLRRCHSTAHACTVAYLAVAHSSSAVSSVAATKPITPQFVPQGRAVEGDF